MHSKASNTHTRRLPKQKTIMRGKKINNEKKKKEKERLLGRSHGMLTSTATSFSS